MALDRSAVEETLSLAERLGLAPLIAIAGSMHVHVALASLRDVPADALREGGGAIERARDGYTKYAFASGLHVIVSSIDVALDRRAGARVLDHVGIDVRRDDEETRARADEAVRAATAEGWRHVAQGGDGGSVACCHASVARKHWLFRDAGAPVELALGPLVVHADAAGRDLRPSDPARARGSEACCAPAVAVVSSSSLRRHAT
jgi:hypothetical protein